MTTATKTAPISSENNQKFRDLLQGAIDSANRLYDFAEGCATEGADRGEFVHEATGLLRAFHPLQMRADRYKDQIYLATHPSPNSRAAENWSRSTKTESPDEPVEFGRNAGRRRDDGRGRVIRGERT